MGALSELDPNLRAKIAEGLPEGSVEKIEAFLGSSSLVGLVFAIETGRISSRKEALGKIYADEEFSKLWVPKEGSTEEEGKYYEKSRKEYAEYLAGGVTPFDKHGPILAAAPFFQDYIAYNRAIGEVGPAFLKVLEILPHTDEAGYKFFLENREVIAALDQQYFTAFAKKDSDKGGVGEAAAKNAKEISDELLTDALFVPFSDAKWREFVRANFSKLFVFTSPFWFPPERLPESTNNTMRFYEGLKRTYFENPAGDMSRVLRWRLGMKMVSPYFSGKELFPELLAKIDEGMNNGSLMTVNDVLEFAVSINFLTPVQRQLSERFWQGKITYDQLKSLVGKLSLLEAKIDEQRTKSDQPRAQALRAFSESELFFDLDPSFVLDHNIFPTESVVAFLKEKGQEGIKELVDLKEKTKRGEFDPSDPLQRDLEYMAYLQLRGYKEDSYSIFSKIEFMQDSEEIPTLDAKDKMEATAAAFEAARVYWMIREVTDRRKKVMVIGNKRYGQLFVVDPLREELELLQDLELVEGVDSSYVRSGSAQDEDKGSKIFDHDVLERIASETPDIIVIDGTEDNVRDINGKNLPRFSRAMMGFYDWVKDFNEGRFGVKPKIPYGITFKSFIGSDQVIVGDQLIRQGAGSDGLQIVVINATIDPNYFPNFPGDLREHKPAYFDDPENTVSGRKILVFTKNGLEEKDKSDEIEYTHAVQALIKELLLEMIMSKATQIPSK